MAAKNSFTQELTHRRIQENERQMDRRLREQQDAEFKRMEQMDEIRDEELENKRKEEQQQMEEENKKKKFYNNRMIGENVHGKNVKKISGGAR
eukprot:UN15314